MASAVATSPAPVTKVEAAKLEAAKPEGAKQEAVKPAGAVLESPAAAAENIAVAPGSAGDEARWRPLFALPCQLTVDLPLPDFTVANLLQMGTGAVLRTGWHVARDVPLRVNETLIGWSEFEAVGNRLAVRLTELA